MVRLRSILLLLATLAAIGLAAYHYFLRPSWEIQTRQRGFDSVTLEMDRLSVTDLMGPPSSVSDTFGDRVFWNNEIRHDTDASVVVESLRYRTNTFYLPIIFEISFDSRGMVVGKHRYD